MGLDQDEQLCTLSVLMYTCLFSTVLVTWQKPGLSKCFVDTQNICEEQINTLIHIVIYRVTPKALFYNP